MRARTPLEYWVPPANELTYEDYPSDPNAFPHTWAVPYTMEASFFPVHADNMSSERFNDRTVSTVDTGDQIRPAIAMGPEGSFVVVWADARESENGRHDIYARLFDPHSPLALSPLPCLAAPAADTANRALWYSLGAASLRDASYAAGRTLARPRLAAAARRRGGRPAYKVWISPKLVLIG